MWQVLGRPQGSELMDSKRKSSKLVLDSPAFSNTVNELWAPGPTGVPGNERPDGIESIVSDAKHMVQYLCIGLSRFLPVNG